VTALLRSEMRKLRTTQVWFWLLIGSLAWTALFVVVTFLTDGVEGNPSPRLFTAEGQRNLFASASAAGVFACVLGIIGITAEYRHLTVTPSYLATPKRWHVIAAKLLTYLLVGLAYAVACVVLVIAMAVPWLRAKDIDVSLTANRIPLVLLAALAVMAIYGIFGVGVGALIRNQIAAVVITLVYLFAIEALIASLPWVRDHLFKYFPGGAAQAVTQVTSGNNTFLAPWQGGLLLAGYGVLFALLASWLTIRRDVT
jgi:ABC-2 type transport system permease protein